MTDSSLRRLRLRRFFGFVAMIFLIAQTMTLLMPNMQFAHAETPVLYVLIKKAGL